MLTVTSSSVLTNDAATQALASTPPTRGAGSSGPSHAHDVSNTRSSTPLAALPAGYEYANIEWASDNDHASSAVSSHVGHEYVNTGGARRDVQTSSVGSSRVATEHAPPPPVRSRPASTLESNPYYVDPAEIGLTSSSQDDNGVYYTTPTPLSGTNAAESVDYSVPVALAAGREETPTAEAPPPAPAGGAREDRLRRNSFC